MIGKVMHIGCIGLVCGLCTLPCWSVTQNATFQDARDKHTYKTVRIGNLEWFAENFAYLPHVSPMGRGKGVWVGRYYKQDTAKARKTEYYKQYGCLYSEKKASELCPPGWRVPTIMDWESLVKTLGGMDKAGNRLKAPDMDHWSVPLENPEQVSGFAALPGGDILIDDVILLRDVGKSAKFWAADANGLIETIYYIADDGFMFNQDSFEDMFGCSVRYVRDVPKPDQDKTVTTENRN